MKLFASDAILSETATLIMNEDIDALEQKVLSGFDINKEFIITGNLLETPLTLALCEKKKKIILWLLSKHVALNDKVSPSIVMACNTCDADIVQLLLDHGANINAKDSVGKTAMNAALYGKNIAIIPFLLSHGYDMKHDGVSLRQAVDKREYKAIKIFLDYGVDVNFCMPNMVFPYNSTPVHIAAQNNDLETLKLLVSHHADVTIKDKYGERPYNCAVDNNNEEMKAFIKSLEPEQWHNEEQRLRDLKSYKIPSELLEILRSNNRRFEMPQNQYVRFLVFNSLLDIKEVNWKKHKFLDLLGDVDNYASGGFLVWYPKKKCLAFADYEHEEFKELCSIKEFLHNPSEQIDKIFY